MAMQRLSRGVSRDNRGVDDPRWHDHERFGDWNLANLTAYLLGSFLSV